MGASVSPEEIAAAHAYEQLHVPALFQQWARRVVDAARIRRDNRVLDVACGTGILAREAASIVGSEGSVAGLDRSPGMLEVARELAPGIEWRLGEAESLPYKDESFDAVISQFGLMFFSDRPKAINEMCRVMVPGGRLAVAVWDKLENSDAYLIEVELLERLAGPRAAEALRAPFALGDRKSLTELFEATGGMSIEIETHHGTAQFPCIRDMVEADLRGWLPVMGVELSEEKIQQILGEAERALSGYVNPQGTVSFESPAHIVSWRKP